MLAVCHNLGERQYVNTPNCGATRDLPDGAVVETPCMVDGAGPHPLVIGSLPLALRGLICAVKAYEQLTVQAAVTGSYQVALQALLAHPLVPSYDVARPLLDELLAANRQHLPLFGK
jgi:6-phospho-beta-glucosidase